MVSVYHVLPLVQTALEPRPFALHVLRDSPWLMKTVYQMLMGPPTVNREHTWTYLSLELLVVLALVIVFPAILHVLLAQAQGLTLVFRVPLALSCKTNLFVS